MICYQETPIQHRFRESHFCFYHYPIIVVTPAYAFNILNLPTFWGKSCFFYHCSIIVVTTVYVFNIGNCSTFGRKSYFFYHCSIIAVTPAYAFNTLNFSTFGGQVVYFSTIVPQQLLQLHTHLIYFKYNYNITGRIFTTFVL